MFKQYCHSKNTTTAITFFKVISLFVFLISATSANGELFKESIGKLPPIEKGKSRLVFYGTNYSDGTYLDSTGPKNSNVKITIDDQNIGAPNGANIYFVMDVPIGKHDIGVLNPGLKKGNSFDHPPYFFNLTQGYTLHAVSGKTYYHEMTMTLHRGIYLSLWRIDGNSAQSKLKRMQNYYDIVLEDKIISEEEE